MQHFIRWIAECAFSVVIQVISILGEKYQTFGESSPHEAESHFWVLLCGFCHSYNTITGIYRLFQKVCTHPEDDQIVHKPHDQTLGERIESISCLNAVVQMLDV